MIYFQRFRGPALDTLAAKHGDQPGAHSMISLFCLGHCMPILKWGTETAVAGAGLAAGGGGELSRAMARP